MAPRLTIRSPFYSVPQENIDLIMSNMSNYYDLRNLKKTSKIFSNTHVFPKLAELKDNKLTMNVSEVKYKSEQMEYFGHQSPPKIRSSFAPEKLNTGMETKFVTFTFSAPCKKSVCELCLEFKFGKKKKNQIKCKIKGSSESIILEDNVDDMYMEQDINTILKFYNRFTKDKTNLLFIVLENKKLDIIITDSKINHRDIFKIL